jgi:hypothetical protein
MLGEQRAEPFCGLVGESHDQGSARPRRIVGWLCHDVAARIE